MFEEYYDRQYDMPRSFNPHVVGHLFKIMTWKTSALKKVNPLSICGKVSILKIEEQ